MFEAILNLLNHPEQFENLQESYSQALSALNDYLKEDSQNKEALQLKVKVACLLHKYQVAKQTAKTLLMLGGEESEYLDLYGQCLLLAGDFDNSESTYMRAYKLDPDSSMNFGSKYKQVKELNKLKKEGNLQVEKGNLDEAIQLYTKGIDRCNELNLDCSYVFMNNRIACYMNKTQYQEALDEIDVSLQKCPFVWKSYIRRIKCIKTLHLLNRMNEIPVDYLNALYLLKYQDKNVNSLCREYLQFLRDNNAYKTNVHSVSSKNDLDRVLRINPDSLIVLDIYASWCGPCKKLAPFMNDLSITHPSVIFLKIDGDVNREVSSQYNVEGFPSIFFIRNGNVIDKVVGYDPTSIEDSINKNLNMELDTIYSL